MIQVSPQHVIFHLPQAMLCADAAPPVSHPLVHPRLQGSFQLSAVLLGGDVEVQIAVACKQGCFWRCELKLACDVD